MENKIEGFYLVSEVSNNSFVKKFFIGTFSEAVKAANKIKVAKGHKTKAMALKDYHYWISA